MPDDDIPLPDIMTSSSGFFADVIIIEGVLSLLDEGLCGLVLSGRFGRKELQDDRPA